MSEGIREAITWALQQTIENEATGEQISITKDTHQELVDKVREYFNIHNIEYSTFSYDNLVPYL